MKMAFEDILNDVGGFGPYQKFLIAIFLIPSSMVIPWFSMSSIFLASTPDHWCHVPELVNSNLSLYQQRQLISPPHDPKCSMYDIDYSSIVAFQNFSIHPDWPTKECDNGWNFDKTDFDATSVTRWQMVCKDDHYSSMVLSLMFIGMTVGTPLFGLMSDRIGRRPTFLLTAFLIGITDIGSTLSPFFELYMVLRTLNGLCITTIYSLAFVLLLELVSPNIRARVNGLSTVSWVVGMCILPLIAWLTRNWVYLSASTTAAAACLLMYWKILPESPPWLISQGRYEEAHDVLATISEWNAKKVHESTQLIDSIQKLGESFKEKKQNFEKPNASNFITYPKLRKRFILVTIAWISGCMPYYGHQVNARNLAGSEFLNFFYLSAVEMPASLAAWAVMEIVGRRWCACGSFAVSALACILPVVIPPEYTSVGVVSALMAKAGASAAYMTIYILAPELFPTPLRSLGMGLCSTIGSASTLLSPYVVYLAKYGPNIPFICFAAIALLGMAVSLFLPETLDQDLPQSVEDVENFVSKHSFFSCGTMSTEEMHPDPSVPDQPLERYSRYKPSWIDASEVRYIQKKRNSIDSILGVFVVPAPNYRTLAVMQESEEYLMR